jgi:hypothetical protein
MCEYDPDCVIEDDEKALRLWALPKSQRVLTVVCPDKRHPIAGVYEDGLLIGARDPSKRPALTLAVPAIPKLLHGYITETDPTIENHHIHAGAYSLPTGLGVEPPVPGWCRGGCGLFGWDLRYLTAALAPWPQAPPPRGGEFKAWRTRRGSWRIERPESM